MAANTSDHLKYKQFLNTSMGFVCQMTRDCKTKALHSEAKNQETFPVNKPSSSPCVESQDIYSSEDAQQVAPIAIATLDDIRDIVFYITSPETSTESKLDLLSDLQKKCKDNSKLQEGVICSGKFVQYTEKLLCLYSKCVGYSVSYTTTTYDLHLLTALLQFLMFMTHMRVHTIRELLVTQSEFLKQLIRVILKHSHHLRTTMNKFEKSSAGKVLTGSLCAMTRREVDENFKSIFGINVSSINLKVEGLNGVLFDTTENQVHDLEIFNAEQKVVDDVHSPEKDGEACKEVYNDVIIAHTLPPNCAFMYIDSSCKDQLLCMSSLLQAEIVTPREENILQIGGVYGLYSAHVVFERMPLLNMECIRGQLLALVSDTAIIWAIDFGLIGLISTRNLHTISSQELLMMPPLAKLCVIEGLVQEAEDRFLCVALTLLRCVIESCFHSVKSMLLCEDQETFFFLCQHYNAEIRVGVLDLLACLARPDKDVASFMEEIHFVKAIVGKLEYCAYVYVANLHNGNTTMHLEIKHMLSIVWSVLEHNREGCTSAEIERVTRAVSMLVDTAYPWQNVISLFLSIQERKLATKQTPRNFYPRRQRDNIDGQRGPRERFPQENWRRRNEAYFHRNSNGFNRMENEVPQRNKTCVYDTEQNSNLKMYNEGESQQRESDSKINKEIGAEKLVNNWRPRNSLQAQFQRGVMHASPCFSTYTDIEDNTGEMLLQPTEAQNDTVDLSTQKGGLDYVIKGTTVSVQPDDTHAFITIQNLKELKEVDFAKVLCGILNNNTKGFLYFGITTTSVIVGITVTRSEKDTFRNGIDRVMRRCLIPEMRGHSYDIAFTPVLCRDERTKDLRSHNVYIIEVQVRPMLHTVYTVFQGRKCYIRNGTITSECAVIQQIQAVMEAKDKEMEEVMKNLNISAIKNSEELTAFVEKYVLQDQSQA